MLARPISNINCQSGNLRLIVPLPLSLSLTGGWWLVVGTNKLSRCSHHCLLIIRGEMSQLAKYHNIWVTLLGHS